MAKIRLQGSFTGDILDIGGGGEGVVGRAYRERVTAIDNRQEELAEAPEGPRKVLMDACSLSFGEASFDDVTAFYFFMYLPKDRHASAINEAYRVLRRGGALTIWDADIDKAEPFLVELDIEADDFFVHTTYGIFKENAAQNAEHFISLAQAAGFVTESVAKADGQFHIVFRKPVEGVS